MLKKFVFRSLALSIIMLSFSYHAQAESKTTTVETSSQTQTTTPAVPAKKSKAVPATTTTSNTRVITTTEVEQRRILDRNALKEIAHTVCAEGFTAYINTDKKNVCQNMASAPDLAYSCVWKKKGAPAYTPTAEGPCNLDFVEHRGSIVVSKSDYTSRPPLPYGTEAQCCFRAAVGSPVSH